MPYTCHALVLTARAVLLSAAPIGARPASDEPANAAPGGSTTPVKIGTGSVSAGVSLTAGNKNVNRKD
jgi:hypothetical protein